jgi:hypothetical protein
MGSCRDQAQAQCAAALVRVGRGPVHASGGTGRISATAESARSVYSGSCGHLQTLTTAYYHKVGTLQASEDELGSIGLQSRADLRAEFDALGPAELRHSYGLWGPAVQTTPERAHFSPTQKVCRDILRPRKTMQ